MQSFWRILTLAAVSGELLCGCSSTYVRQSLDMPSRFAHAATTDPERPVLPADDRWWRATGDPVLGDLVDRVLLGNRNLALATLTLRRAQLQAGLAELDQWPTASGNLSGSRTGRTSAYTANLAVSYDADLWRRLAATTSAAQWEARATEQDRNATRISLVATTCTLYWDILFTRQQIATGEAGLVAQRRLLQLVTAQRTYGALSTVEVAEADLAVETQVAAQSVLAQHLVEDEAALGLLTATDNSTGTPIWSDLNGPNLNGIKPPDVPAGLPASLVGRRPDVMAAEMRLRSSLALVDAAHAAFYPDLALTAGGGAASSSLSSLLNHPVGSMAAAVSLPFLDFPRHRQQSRTAAINHDIAILAFKTVVFQALSEVDNALSARRELQAQHGTLIKSLESAKTVERLVGVRYQAGSVALDILLDAQQRLRDAQRAIDTNALARLTNFATLSLALGGSAVAAE